MNIKHNSNVLVCSDDEYPLRNNEVEYISNLDLKYNCLRLITLESFLKGAKLPIYLNYEYIIISDPYLTNLQLLFKLELFLLNNSYLYLVFKDESSYNNNEHITTFLKKYQYTFITLNQSLIIKARRSYE
ncbi:MAG: hypothetical protein ACRCTA_06795 [Bacilli bacterium]